ncbi:hypothetical protein [Sinorhizobium medicae]|uniref:hypothetical protein n=1 Tax=Sinorhizobium medicae TaxID=110321 RepID=UPI000FD81895|nr:hypothetical protein [Sinorhizobium medicae]MDX0439141.1 hypothetical protein [Sinorhizobium medicae]MDX0617560.1 hypothetical protein [Sinorhizobium medicae]MDX0654713.1 hypothetical protein [Sinorhizobium medicae]MDX1090921.1 hypothetical protein [Sinorhizobium medicae]MDX1115552.1 hypothetical protein [Sinorhizobium medicae]
MSIEQQQFFMELGTLLMNVKEDLELVADSKTDLPAPIMAGFKERASQVAAMEQRIDDIVAVLGLKKRGM